MAITKYIYHRHHFDFFHHGDQFYLIDIQVWSRVNSDALRCSRKSVGMNFYKEERYFLDSHFGNGITIDKTRHIALIVIPGLTRGSTGSPP